jgi:PAS domain S-box-containing protein
MVDLAEPAQTESSSDILDAARPVSSAVAINAINQRIFETSHDVILIVDRRGTFVRVSPSVQAILGYLPHEMVGHSAADFIYREDLDPTRCHMRSSRYGGTPNNFECRYVHKQGRIVLLWWIGGWSEPEGQYFFIGRDITEQKRAMEALRGSENQLKRAQRLAHLGANVSNLRTRTIEWSDETYRIFGVTRETFVPTTDAIMAMVHPGDRDRLWARVGQVRQGIPPEAVEYRIVRPDGTVRHVYRESEIVTDDDGSSPGFLISTIQDITERRRAEEQQRESAARLALAVDMCEIGLANAESPTAAAKPNEQFNKIYGLPPDKEAVGVGEWLRLIHPDDRDRVASDALAAIKDGDLYRGEFRIRRADTGEERWIRAATRTVPDPSGRPGSFLGVHIDITDLKENARLLEAAMGIAKLGTWSTDVTTGPDVDAHVELSAEVGRIFGLAAGEFDNRAGSFRELVHPEDREALAQSQRRAIEDGVPYNAEFRVVRPDKTLRRVQLRAGVLRDAVGVPTKITGVMQDVTELRSVEERLQQAQRMDAIGQLTGGMAHDFNNLLGIIIANLDLMKLEGGLDTGQQELVTEAIDAAMRGADLTRRLLAFARRQRLQPERVVVNDLVSSIVGLLSRTLGENIPITTTLGADLWPVSVDPAQLESAIVNLATNARDAMPRGGRLLIATANRVLDEEYAAGHEELNPGDYVMVEVSDTGDGIPPDVLQRVFEPFFTTKEPGKGTGLGLAMVFGFVKQSGGHINVYSEVGRGTTFRLYLPRDKTGISTGSEIERGPAAAGGSETVLVVEDNDALRRVVRRQLSQLGYDVIDTDNAVAALAIMEQQVVDLLLTDIVMPGEIDGVELARTAMARWPAIKVVLTSGFPENRLSGEPIIGLRLLGKPYRRDELARTLREILDRGQAAGT